MNMTRYRERRIFGSWRKEFAQAALRRRRPARPVSLFLRHRSNRRRRQVGCATDYSSKHATGNAAGDAPDNAQANLRGGCGRARSDFLWNCRRGNEFRGVQRNEFACGHNFLHGYRSRRRRGGRRRGSDQIGQLQRVQINDLSDEQRSNHQRYENYGMDCEEATKSSGFRCCSCRGLSSSALSTVCWASVGLGTRISAFALRPKQLRRIDPLSHLT